MNKNRDITIHSKVTKKIDDFLMKMSEETKLTKSYLIYMILDSFCEVHKDEKINLG